MPADRVPNAAATNVDRDADGEPQVYATVAATDGIASVLGNWAMPLRENPARVVPTEREFGTKAFSSDGDGSSPGAATTSHGMIEGRDNRLEENHADTKYGYLEEGSQSHHTILKIVNGHSDHVTQVDQSFWDDRHDRVEALEALDPTRYEPVVDAWQRDRRARAEAALTGRHALLDSYQAGLAPTDQRHLVIDGMQALDEQVVQSRLWVEEGLVDGTQELLRTPRDLLEAGLHRSNETLKKLDEGVDVTEMAPGWMRGR